MGLRLPAAVLLFLITIGQSLAEEATERAWQAYYDGLADSYRVTLPSEGERQPLARSPKPILDWASVNDYNGALYIWTLNGRPEAAGTFFSFSHGKSNRMVVHEFASFSYGQLQIQSDGGRDWSPPPLKSYVELPDAPLPATALRVRRLQCRGLAKEFSAYMIRDGKRWELRLLPRPIYEFGEVSEDVLGGALFAFVAFSTDPDILLLLETRNTDRGLSWVYQPIRFSDKSLFLEFRRETIWESLRERHGPRGPDTLDPQYEVIASETVDPTTIKVDQ